MTRVRIPRPSGFTLIEVLLALSLLGIGLLSLAAMQLIALEMNNRGRHQTVAATMAERRMEELMRRTWTDPDLAPTGGWTAPATVTSDVQTAGGDVTEQSFTISERISDVDPGRTRSIDVRVQWNEPGRSDRQYALSNLRFNYEGL